MYPLKRCNASINVCKDELSVTEVCSLGSNNKHKMANQLARYAF